MGSSFSTTSITEQEMQDYLDLTYLSKKEILEVYKRFNSYIEKDEDVRTASLTKEKFLKIPELKVNPFKERICDVFSSNHNDSITFEDYLDMMSVFSESAPTQIKIEYAFRIYDFDRDEMIGTEDIRTAIGLLTGGKDIEKDSVDLIIEKVFSEADLDGDRKLCYAEFEHAMTKSLDFPTIYCVRL